ncbi:MAG: bifunctional DNA primase/polymerase [Chloroflexi bacterium]|nr:bifunctional DNA primase/polymerase [Chloroflexota bacterium]
MEVLEAALQLADSGFRIIPLHSPDPEHSSGCSCRDQRGCESVAKHPRTMHGVKDASSDEATIRRWWGLWPEANIGIATGDGLVVLDVDPRHDGDSSLQELEDEHREIVTLAAHTGGGGTHLYLQGDLPSRGAFLDGLDLKSAGGYVVAPPSVHASGRRYAWVDRGEGIRVVPDWLAGIVNASKSKNGAAR